eukprot:4675314-Pleurochrysis_carterae.AAC.2
MRRLGAAGSRLDRDRRSMPSPGVRTPRPRWATVRCSGIGSGRGGRGARGELDSKIESASRASRRHGSCQHARWANARYPCRPAETVQGGELSMRTARTKVRRARAQCALRARSRTQRRARQVSAQMRGAHTNVASAHGA